MRRSGRTAAVGFLVASAIASAAWSQDADALIDRGVELRANGQDEVALQMFRQAWEARRSPRALVQIALAEQALGRWVDAEAHLAEALTDARDPWVRRHLRALRSAQGEIRQHVGELQLQGNVPGAEVLMGGRVVCTLPATLRVPTGAVTFTVRALGYESVTRTVSVEGPAPHREVVALEPEARAAVAALPTAPPGLRRDDPTTSGAAGLRRGASGVSTRRAVSYGLIGVGAAALVVSGVFFGLNANLGSETAGAIPTSADPYGAWARFQADENSGRERTGAQVCEIAQQRVGVDAAQVRDLCSSTSTTATLALVAGIAGGALAATGLVLVLTERPAATRAARWAAAPWLARGVGGVTVGAAW
jgi:hypothetical protein